MRISDRGPSGFSWTSGLQPWLERMSHALVADSGVWVVDASDAPGLDGELLARGRPRGVVQLLDRHRRDCAALAERLGVPLYENPVDLPGSPFEPVSVRMTRRWRETALWWPEQRTLVVAETLGTARYYCAPGRRLGVHPFVRLGHLPRELVALAPEHLLVGHGPSLHDRVPEELTRAVRRARWELPLMLPRLLTAGRGARRARPRRPR